MRVLQTRALPLGYGAIYLLSDFNKSISLSQPEIYRFMYDSNGNRTRVTAVKGRCLNRLTTEPYSLTFPDMEKLPE